MASYTKRGRYWRAFTCVRGERQSKTFDSKREARQWAEEVEEGKHSLHTLHAALDLYLEEESPKHRGERWERARLLRFKREFDNIKLSEFTPSIVSQWRNKRLKTVTNGAVRRDIALLKSVLRVARDEWEWLHHDPFKGVRMPPKPLPRRRGISQKEIDIILKQGKWCGVVESKTDEVIAAFLIGIETAMRASEIIECSVNFTRRIATVIETKNGDKRDIPLSKKALELYALVGSFSITAASLSTLFRRIKNSAGLPDLHFHDTRSEALTRLSKKLDVLQLARMVGHRDTKSLLYYYAESAEDMAELLD